MTLTEIQKSLFSSLLTVALLAILHFLPNVLAAQHTITLTPQKGSDLYIGVDNPILVKVDGIADDQVYLASDGVEIENMGNGLYNVQVSYPGKTTFTVHGEGFQYKNFDLQVLRVSDPLAALRLENGEVKMDGDLTAESFIKTIGIGFDTGGYQGQLQLEIASYDIIRVPKMGDVIEVPNTGAEFNKRTLSLVKSAIPGDTFYVQNVLANVAGAKEPRKMNSLVFKIK